MSYAPPSLPPADTNPDAMPPAPVWAAIQVQGPDARTFLQGQLTQDLRALTGRAGLRAALCVPQGRVIACLWLIETAAAASEPGVWIVLPGELASAATAALRRYVLRARVRIPADQEFCAAQAWLANDPAAFDAWFAAHDTPALAVRRASGATWLRVGPRRALSIPEAGTPQGDGMTAPAAGVVAAERAAFELAAIRDGEPMVYAATRERWVPQMLNLDLVDGISFAKGCYTGQEIVARTQHRGHIKRRMLRYAVRGTQPPMPGEPVLSAGGKAGEVVRAAPDGPDAELLTVVSLEQAGLALHLESGTTLMSLPLPYPFDAA